MSGAPQPGLSPVRLVLPNGATIIAKRSTATPAVSLDVSLPAGVMHEPADRPGVANLLARTIDRGTARRPASVIADELDGRGVALGVTMNRHNLTLSCTCLADDAGDVMDLVLDIVRDPIFPEAQVARRRHEIVTGLRQDEDNPAVRAVLALLGLLYGERHAYGRPPKGSVADVERLGRDDVAAFHARQVAPGGVVLVVVGDIETDRAVEMAASRLEDWTGASPAAAPVGPPAPAGERRRLVVPMMNKSQADVACGFVTVPRSDPAFYAVWVMNTVLGQYGLGGRLGDNIRERQGMAYYVFSTFEPAPVAAPLIVRAGVAAANVDRTIAAIDQEIAAIARDGVTDEELTDTRRFLTLSMPRLLETNAGVATFLQTAEFFGLGMDYDSRLPALLAGVSREAVADAARRLDPARASIAVAGPYAG